LGTKNSNLKIILLPARMAAPSLERFTKKKQNKWRQFRRNCKIFRIKLPKQNIACNGVIVDRNDHLLS